MEIYLLRHSHAGDPAKWHGDDASRPLSERGRNQATRLARHLRAIDVRPDVIVSSPKARSRETAEIIGRALGRGVTLDERAASGLGLPELGGIIREAGMPASVMIVGHDPDLSALLAEMTGGPPILMRKGSLARVDVDPPTPDRPLARGCGTLAWLVPPELLDRA